MVGFPPVNIPEKTSQYRLVEQFIRSAYWELNCKDLFSDNIVVDLPHAPFGMPQHLSAFEFEAMRYWLRQTVMEHRLQAEPCIIPTTDPNLFWTIHWVSDKVHWAKQDGQFDCEFASRITIHDGKITDLREYANPLSFYRAIGISLPQFRYLEDTVSCPSCTRMRPDQASHFTREENMQRAIRNFANPISGQDDDPEPIYAWDVVEVTPFAPADMPEIWTGAVFDQQGEWMFRTVPEWNTAKQIPLYRSIDPNTLIVESIGYGRTTWSGCAGHYTQRELQIVHLNPQGKVDHFRVYFNSLNKFLSMNLSIPSFPYFNF